MVIAASSRVPGGGLLRRVERCHVWHFSLLNKWYRGKGSQRIVEKAKRRKIDVGRRKLCHTLNIPSLWKLHCRNKGASTQWSELERLSPKGLAVLVPQDHRYSGRLGWILIHQSHRGHKSLSIVKGQDESSRAGQT